jgi:hypothetical protein
MRSSIIFVAFLMVIVGCNSASEESPATGGVFDELTGKSDQGGTYTVEDPHAEVCSLHTTLSDCLDEPGCGFGDRGHGLECYFVGHITPQNSK